MLQGYSQTLLNLTMPLSVILGVIAIAALIALGIAIMRYLTAEDHKEERCLEAKKGFVRIALPSVIIALLAGGIFVTNMWSSITDVGGMTGIEQGTNAFRAEKPPKTEYEPTQRQQQKIEQESYDKRASDNSEVIKTHWEAARKSIYMSGCTTSDEAHNNDGVMRQLKKRGIKNLDDPALWENIGNARWNKPAFELWW